MTRLLLLAVLTLAVAVHAQGLQAPSPDAELSGIQSEFDYGKFGPVLEHADARIDHGGMEESELISLHKYAGLAAFNLNLRSQAQRHFEALLRLDPDFALDPFAVPPPAIEFLDRIRNAIAPELSHLREEHRFRLERGRREQELRLERERLAELERRNLEEFSHRQAEQVSSRSFAVNFIPFGGGQFQSGRTGMGAAFAAVEGAFAVLSIASFWIYQSLISTSDLIVDPDQSAGTLHQQGLRPEDVSRARLLTQLKYIGAGGFYVVYAGGVVDALIRYGGPWPGQPVSKPAALAPHAFFMPLPGGGGLGVSSQF